MERLSDNDICIRLTSESNKKKVDVTNKNTSDTEVIINHHIESETMTDIDDKNVGSEQGDNSEGKLKQKKDTEEEADHDINEEKVSLLVGQRPSIIHPVPSVVLSPKNSQSDFHRDSIQLVPVSPSSPHTKVRLATPDPDIQLAEVEAVSKRPECHRRRSLYSSYWADNFQLSSIQTVCGPQPGKITVICVIVLSIWAAGMLLFHLNKKVDMLTSSLTETKDMIKTMEDSNMDYRSKSNMRIQKLNNKISKIITHIKTDGKSSSSESLPSSRDPKSYETKTVISKPPTPSNNSKEDDDLVGDGETTKTWWDIW